MRRSEKEIKELKAIEAVIKEAEVCHLGLAVDNIPYIVPVFFGYENHNIYIHCAGEGRKMDMIRQNSTVCFEMTVDVKVINQDNPPCQWSSTYRSVIGAGRAEILNDCQKKKQALDVIMKHYSSLPYFEYSEKSIENVSIVKIEITEMSGKSSNSG